MAVMNDKGLLESYQKVVRTIYLEENYYDLVF